MTNYDDNLEIEKIRVYVAAAEAEINGIEIIPRKLTRYPFDSVAFEMISKVFALSKACLTLLDASFPDEAYGLCRSLVECAITLRYLTQDLKLRDARTDDFIKYELANKSYWLHYALEQFSGRPEEQTIKEYAKQQGIVADPKSARRHWSGKSGFVWELIVDGHPLDGPTTTEPQKKVSYAVDYHQTSAFVHCSQPALNNYIPDGQNAFRVSTSSGKYDQPSQKILFIILTYLHSSIAYALFGLGVERPTRLNTLFEESLKSLKPYQPLHS